MNPQDPRNEEQKGFGRPWEADDTAETEVESNVVPLPGLSDPDEEADSELSDWEAMAASSSDIEDFSPSEYMSSSTQEYEGLAEDVARAAD